MHRLLLACVAAALSTPLFAVAHLGAGDRVAVLRPRGGSSRVVRVVQHTLIDELRSLGVDAFDAGVALDEVGPQPLDAPYAIDVEPVDAAGRALPASDGPADPEEAVEAGAGRIDVAVRLYDAAARTQIGSFDIHRTQDAAAHASLQWVPFVRYARMRAAARAAARQAASDMVQGGR